jgi:hypothetical protein
VLLEIEFNMLYANGLFICYAGAGNGRSSIQSGRYPVEPTYSHAFRKNLVRADGLGWIGASQEYAVVLGRVRNRDDVLPCESFEKRLFALVESAEELGQSVELVVQ